MVRALRAGARAYILKGHVHRELLETIRTVHSGGKRIPPDIASELAEHVTEDELSNREIEVLRLIAGGNSNKAIADQTLYRGSDRKEPRHKYSLQAERQ